MRRFMCSALILLIACSGGETTGLPDRRTFVRLSAGNGFTCALTEDGAPYCWGANDHGQLGDGTTTNRESPTKVATSLRFIAITTGFTHACALAENGAAYCWGANDWQKLGSSPSSTTELLVPTAVNGNLRFVSIAASMNNTCATTAEHTVYCWGQLPETNQFGDFIPKTTGNPTSISGGMVAVVSGQKDYCTIDTAGLAYCWGLVYFFPPSGPALPPVGQALSTTLHFSVVSRGTEHGCGIDTGGAAWCWGKNRYGELGNGSLADAAAPVPVSGNLSFQAIAAGNYFTCGVATGGKLYCWGAANLRGRVPDGTITNATTPQPVSSNVLFTKVAAGVSHACAVGADGSTYCWGPNTAPVVVDGM